MGGAINRGVAMRVIDWMGSCLRFGIKCIHNHNTTCSDNIQ